MIKQYDLFEYRHPCNLKANTYCLLETPEKYNGHYEETMAIEMPLVDDYGYVPVYRVEWESSIFEDDDPWVYRIENRDEYISINELAEIEVFKERCKILKEFHEKVEKLKQRWGTVIYKGAEYICLESATADVDGYGEGYYHTFAVKEPDVMDAETFPDEFNRVGIYEVIWSIHEEFVDEWEQGWNEDEVTILDDERFACADIVEGYCNDDIDSWLSRMGK